MFINLSLRTGFWLAANGSGIGEVGEIEFR